MLWLIACCHGGQIDLRWCLSPPESQSAAGMREVGESVLCLLQCQLVDRPYQPLPGADQDPAWRMTFFGSDGPPFQRMPCRQDAVGDGIAARIRGFPRLAVRPRPVLAPVAFGMLVPRQKRCRPFQPRQARGRALPMTELGCCSPSIRNKACHRIESMIPEADPARQALTHDPPRENVE